MNEGAIEKARRRQEMEAAGYTLSDKLGWMENLWDFFGWKPKRREETDVVYMPNVLHPPVASPNNITHNNNAVSATSTSTSTSR